MVKNNEIKIELVDSIANMIATIGLVERNKYLSSPVIMDSRGKDVFYQRIMINRYFINELLKWRAGNNVSVNEMIACLFNDGDLDDWIRVFASTVLPFIKQNNVLGVQNESTNTARS